MRLTCKHCGRYLGEAKGTAIVEGLICPNSKCKARLNIKVVTPTSSPTDICYKFTNPEQAPRAGARSTKKMTPDSTCASGAPSQISN